MTGNLSTARIDSGFIDYVDDGRSIPFWCRTGAGEVLVSIYCPRAVEWQQQHAWALDRKQEIFDTEAIIALKRV